MSRYFYFLNDQNIVLDFYILKKGTPALRPIPECDEASSCDASCDGFELDIGFPDFDDN